MKYAWQFLRNISQVFQGNVKNLERSGTEISAAIKMLWKDASSNEKKKFLKEARLMNYFRHKHILRLLAVCLDGDSPSLVLELMETGDLLKYLRDCRASVRFICSAFARFARHVRWCCVRLLLLGRVAFRT